ncbi:CapA family protein [Thermovenabulum sp.]|uniref:CapA family protein n=1 Tax=Thermovenabulum sp. TaxID=3100335 RepID=UPI003C7EC2C9
MKRSYKFIIIILIPVLLFFSFFILWHFKIGIFKEMTVFAVSDKEKENNVPVEEDIEETSKTVEISLIAAGDVMMHVPQIRSGYDEKTQKYNFDYFFDEVREDILSGDVAIANLETTLAGKERRFTGFPLFNAPDEIADALKNAGFDIVVTSNNHSMDRGEEGVLRTIQVLKERGLINVGTNSNEQEDILRIIEVKNVKIGFLAYTYGTNGIPVKKPFLVNIIDENKILDDISSSKKKVDVLVVYFHFGNEYQRTPSQFQKDLSQKAIKEGADIVLGSHPHVVQPGEFVAFENNNGVQKKYIRYSLGNFISAQKLPYTDEGLILKIILEVNKKDNKVDVKDVEEIPTWVHRYRDNGLVKYVVKKGNKPPN